MNLGIPLESTFHLLKGSNARTMQEWSFGQAATFLKYWVIAIIVILRGVVEKAKMACFNSGHRIEDHFVDVTEMIEIGKGGQRPVKTILLSRYACYLAIQNADPKKEMWRMAKPISL